MRLGRVLAVETIALPHVVPLEMRSQDSPYPPFESQ